MAIVYNFMPGAVILLVLQYGNICIIVLPLYHMSKIRQSARIILLNPHHHIFLMHVARPEAAGFDNASDQSYWITPGGKIESGETVEVTVRRELYEETGIENANIITPHIWYNEYTIMYKGSLTLFQEWFFVAHTTENNILIHHYTAAEKDYIGACKWWTLEELSVTKELFYPLNLCELLSQLTR